APHVSSQARPHTPATPASGHTAYANNCLILHGSISQAAHLYNYSSPTAGVFESCPARRHYAHA
ncbi:MAG: hypothetical protein ABI456_08500, partial [Ktedonobacteraceae bacterium]